MQNATGFVLLPAVVLASLGHGFWFSSTLLISVESCKNFIWIKKQRKDEAKHGCSLLKFSGSNLFLKKRGQSLVEKLMFKLNAFCCTLFDTAPLTG